MKVPLIKNTVTNYLGMFIRLVQGVLVTRWTVLNLGKEDYGLWVSLWSFYGYGLLLDFGMGVAGQKATAVELWQKDIQKYNRLIGTIVGVNMLMSCVILACTCLGTYYVRALFNLDSGEEVWYCRLCFMTCGLGAAVLFPTGVFEEMLIGLQKIYIRNYIVIVRNVLELLLVILVFWLGGGVFSLLLCSLSCMLLTALTSLFFIYRHIPGFQFKCWISREIFHEIFSFSGSAYVISIARMVWNRGPLILLGVLGGLQSVAIYQLGCRFPVLMVELTKPYQENISPLSALLYSRGKRRKLGCILLNSMRWNSFLATGLTIMVFVYARLLIRGIFGVDSNESTLICQIMAVSFYLWLIFRYIPERYLMMAERHGLLAWSYSLCCLLFVLASVLLSIYSILDVTYAVMASFIGSLFVSTMLIDFPCMLHDTDLRFFSVIRATLFRPIVSSLPVMLLAYFEYCVLADAVGDVLMLALAGLSCGPLYLLTSYLWLVTPEEKRLLRKKLQSRFSAATGGR